VIGFTLQTFFSLGIQPLAGTAYKTVEPSVTVDIVANRTILTLTRKWITVEGGYVD